MHIFFFKKDLPGRTHYKIIEQKLFYNNKTSLIIETYGYPQNSGYDSYKDKPCVIEYGLSTNKIYYLEWSEKGKFARHSKCYPYQIFIISDNTIKLCYKTPSYNEKLVDGTEITKDLYTLKF